MVTPANWIIKAYQDLMMTILGIPNSYGDAYMEALECIQDAMHPQLQHKLEKTQQTGTSKGAIQPQTIQTHPA